MIHDSRKTSLPRAGSGRSIIVLAVLAITLAGTATPTRGATVNINPSHDSYVRLKDGSNYGGQTDMCVGEYSIPNTPYRIQRPYLKFDLSSIPADKEIRWAKLWLYCSSLHGGPVEVGAHYLDCDDWLENSIGGDGAPTAYREAATDTVTLTAMSFNSWVVTRDVRIAYYGDEVYGVVMKLASEGTSPAGAWLDSKEGANPPYLEIQYEDGEGDTVVCEPQGGANPTHPPTYWYDVTLGGSFDRCDFHVRVYDRNPANYTNPTLPPGITWQFRVHPVGDQDDEWWASWWSPECAEPISGPFRFQFDNDNPSTWGDWTTTIDGTSNAFEQVVDSSWSHTADSNGYGYLVHVPSDPKTYVVDPFGTGDFPTIQAAIDAAWDRDTIELTNGTFTGPGNRDIDFLGKAITVRSQSGNPESCIIDCEGTNTNGHRGFYFHKGEEAESVLDGITTTDGYGAINTNGPDGWVRASGGGALCDSCSSPTLINCVFSANTTEGDGGGMACWDSSSPTLTGCVLTDNTITPLTGGFGGGMYCDADCEAELTDCTLSLNKSGDDGGGMAARASVMLEDCTFDHNQTALANGGGMDVSTNAYLNRCFFYGNYAKTDGGGFHGNECDAEIVNCAFSGNEAENNGGGMAFFRDSDPLIVNCTLSGNWACGNGGGIAVMGELGRPSAATVDNSIIAFSDPGEAVWCDAYGSATLRYCDVYGNVGGDWVSCITGQNGSSGNISADPLFVDSNGVDDIVGTEDDNLRLAAGSPCIDAGSSGLVPAGIEEDLDRLDRFVDFPPPGGTGFGVPPTHPEIVDMGAYEAQDCNTNGYPDAVDIAAGTSEDYNDNDIPDECEGVLFGFFEPFQAYADQTAFELVWTDTATPDSEYFLDTNGMHGNPGQCLALPSPSANTLGRYYYNLGVDLSPGDGESLLFSYDLWLEPDGAPTNWWDARHYTELRGYSGDAVGVGDLENLLAIGVSQQTDPPDVFNTAKYQGRVVDGVNWQTLDEGAAPSRATDWHEMMVMVTGNHVRFFVDGILSETEFRPNAYGFDSIALGSDLTANGHDARADNVHLRLIIDCNTNAIPDPADIAGGTSEDLDSNGIPDECAVGCNSNGDCDDSNVCTDDVCDAGTCVYMNNTASCDDELYCNGPNDTCSDGICSHSGDPCVGGGECNETCNEDTDDCYALPDTPCGDPTDDDCTDPDTCDGAGGCQANHAPSGTPCPDALYCNGAETCDGSGICQSASYPCTGSEWCDESTEGCVGHGNGDFEPDSDVDLADFAEFQTCFDQEIVAGSPCEPANLTGTNGIIDLDDYALLHQGFTGPGSFPPSGMVLIPGGAFEMGCRGIWPVETCFPDDEHVHNVHVDPFFMDVYEVTNQQYCAYLNSAYGQEAIDVGTDGVVYKAGDTEPYCNTYSVDAESRIHWDGNTFTITADKEDHPMLEVSWYGVAAYANWRSEQDGRTPCYDLSAWTYNFDANGYRLPTEAEWEYAARGGEHNPYYAYPWGNDNHGSYCNYGGSGDSFEGDDPPKTTPVGYYDGGQSPAGGDMANGYGLYDMAGNVWEWCNDWHGEDYYYDSPYYNPQGPASGTLRVLRGGAWSSGHAYRWTCGHRLEHLPDRRDHGMGFRVAAGT